MFFRIFFNFRTIFTLINNFPIETFNIHHHRREKIYRGKRDSFVNDMTRGTTWEGVECLVLRKVQIKIALQ